MREIIITVFFILAPLNLYCEDNMQEQLIQAVESGNKALVQKLLDDEKTTKDDINECDPYNSTLLNRVAINGYSEIAEMILSHPKANNNIADISCGGLTPLYTAAVECNDSTVKVLLNSDKVTEQTVDNAVYQGQTALMAATDTGCSRVVKLLVSPSYDKKVNIEYINKENKSGLSALNLARLIISKKSYREICRDIYKSEFRQDEATNQYAKCEAERAITYDVIIDFLDDYEQSSSPLSGCNCNTIGR